MAAPDRAIALIASVELALDALRVFLRDVPLTLRLGEVDEEIEATLLFDRVTHALPPAVVGHVGDDPSLIDKVQRFNRFFHSDHRVRVHQARDDLLEIEHVGPHETPSRNESIYILGLHLAVLTELGCEELQCRLPKSADPRASLLDGSRVLPPPPGGAHVWRFTWRRFTPKRKPFEGLDELLISRGKLADYEAARGVDESVLGLVETDLARRWVVADVARALAMSARTLQRELAARHTSFSTLLEEARVSAASRLLREENRTITEVGYVCGFADTAHFSRRFKVCTGVTPSTFKKRARQG